MSTPNLLTRSTRQVDMMIPRNPNIQKYRVRGHNTLDGAFVSSVSMFEVESGFHYRSPTLVNNRKGFVEDTKRGQTRLTFDPNDFSSTSPFLPPDDETLYLRVEDFDLAAGSYLPPGTILIVPPPRYFGVQDSVVTVYGNAPGISATPGLKPPPGTMAFGLPLYTSSATLKNLDGSNNLLISFNSGMSMIPVAAGDVFQVDDGSIVDVFVASENGSSVSFSMTFTLTKV